MSALTDSSSPGVPTPRRYVLDPLGRDIGGESRELRRYGRVAPIELPGEVSAWGVTSPALLRELLTSPHVSRDPNRHWSAWRDGQIPDDWVLAPWVSMRNLLTAYGDEHRRLRSLVSRAFTASRIRALAPRVRATCDRLLDEMTNQGGEEVIDIRAAYALPVPLTMISEMFGLPRSLRPMAHECMSDILSPTPGSDPLASYTRLREVLVELVAAKRARPGEDLVSALIAARDGEHPPLTETELVDTLGGVLGGGFETTTSLVDQAITALCSHPDQLALVRSGVAGWDDVVEETLRWAAPLPYMPLRYAVSTLDLGETVIQEGEAIVACYGAAGRDPQVHGPDADAFSVTRPSRRLHMSFGFGPHVCLGALLARMEATKALEALFTRYPRTALAVPVAELEPISLISNGHQTLPITLGTRSVGVS